MPSINWIVLGLGVIAVIVLYLNVTTTIAVSRSSNLSGIQKLGQIAVAWLIPILGARLVTHFLVEHDIASIPTRLVSNDTVNHYLLTALGVPARHLTSVAKAAIQQEIYEAVSNQLSDKESSETSAPDGGGAASGSGD